MQRGNYAGAAKAAQGFALFFGGARDSRSGERGLPVRKSRQLAETTVEISKLVTYRMLPATAG
jgi:hypothetical protein